MDSCFTTIHTKKCDFQWTIDNFKKSHLQSTEQRVQGTILKSPSFTVDITNWHLELQLYGSNDDNNKGYIGIYLHLDNANSTPEIWSQVTISILKSNNIVANSFKPPFWKFTEENCGWGCAKFINIEKLLKKCESYLPNDQLTICGEMLIKGDRVLSIPNYHAPKVIRENLSYHFGKLLISEKYSDVAFSIYGDIIKAHKRILSARCPFFKTLFKHSIWHKNVMRVIEITDMDPIIFQKMLQYIYTDQVGDLDESAMELFAAAEKYQLDELKEMCENSLRKNINVDNAAELFALSYHYDAKELMEYTRHFFDNHLQEVIKTPGYETIKKKQPNIAIMINQSVIIDN